MRRITTHRHNVANEHITVEAVDERGSGNANHRYDLTGFDTEGNPSATAPDGFKAAFSRIPLVFQNGPVMEAGINGITNEALLAVVIDRMQGFQSGPYACRENALALTKLEEAMHWMRARTRRREADGTEGTHKGT